MRVDAALAWRCKLAPLRWRSHPGEAGLADLLSAITSALPERFGFQAPLRG